MTHGTSAGLVRILGHVTAIVMIPMLTGTVAGLVADRILGTSPLFVLSGFVVGNLVAIGGIWLYIRVQRSRIQHAGMGSPDDE
jgi:F0F1-type ATP synthase assembly protein I